MINEKEHIITSLIAENYINEDQKDNALHISEKETDDSSPWYVQLLIGTGAWIASIIFAIFFALTDIVNSEESAMIVGAIILVGVLTIAITNKDITIPIFPQQLLLSASFSGHILFVFGIANIFEKYNSIAAVIVLLVSKAFLIYYPGKLHKIVSSWLILASLWFLLYKLGIPEVTTTALMVIFTAGLSTWMWMNESDYLTESWSKIGRSVQYAVISGFLLVVGSVENYSGILYWVKLPSNNLVIWNLTYAEVVSSGLFVVISLAVLKIFKRLDINRISITSISIVISTLVLSIIFYRSPSILASLLVLIIGIERGNKLLVPISIVSLVYFYSSYYYRLDISLMDKSFILMGSGLLMIITGYVLSRGGKKV